MTTNHFALRLTAGPESAGKIDLNADVWIDGDLLDQPFYVNLPELVQSVHRPGEYEIFVCGCGSAGCAGAATVLVSHDGSLIRWKWNLPTLGMEDGSEPDKGLPTIPVTFTFGCEQMIGALEAFVANARHIVGAQADEYDWPVVDFAVKNLLMLDPSKPYRPCW